MEKVTAEPMFFRMIEEDGTLSFVIGPKDGTPDSPRLLFDGKEPLVHLSGGGAVLLNVLDAVGITESLGIGIGLGLPIGQTEYFLACLVIGDLDPVLNNARSNHKIQPRRRTPKQIRRGTGKNHHQSLEAQPLNQSTNRCTQEEHQNRVGLNWARAQVP